MSALPRPFSSGRLRTGSHLRWWIGLGAIATVALLSSSISPVLAQTTSVDARVSSMHPAPALTSSYPTWTRLSSVSPHPSARYGAVMAYDPTDGYVVLFSGVPSGRFLNDTWTYLGGTWARLDLPVAPAPRAYATMTWDASDGYLLLFGGETNHSSHQGCSATSNLWVYCNDTWKFVHGSWTLLHPSSSPPARYSAAMTFDPSLHKVVLGGGAGAGNLSDMWTYHAGRWTNENLTPGSPQDPFHGRYSSLAYDGHDRSLLYFGDRGFPGNETWKYSGGNWTELSLSRAPPAVMLASLVFDPAVGKLILFGGARSFGPPGAGASWATWGFENGSWTNLTHGVHPAGRSAAVMVYDGADGYVLLFGGLSNSGARLGDTWTLG
jgi:hypothetical protein